MFFPGKIDRISNRLKLMNTPKPALNNASLNKCYSIETTDNPQY